MSTIQMNESMNKAFYDADSSTYDDSRWNSKGGEFTNRVQQRVVHELCAKWRGQSVVEVGPGTARFSIPLLRQMNRLTLVDISRGMLETARKNISASGLSEGIDDLVTSTIYELPFEDSSFDHAISINVFNHLERPGEALKQLSRVIRSGGTVCFNYANLNSYYWLAAKKINHRHEAHGQSVYSTWEIPSAMEKVIASARLKLVKRVGNVHMPRGLERFPVLPAIKALDSISRNGPFNRLAPFHFCLCEKL